MLQRIFFASKPFSNLRHYIITAMLVASTTAVACLTCDLAQIIDLAGGIGASILAFVIPPACLMKVCHMRSKNGGSVMALKSRIFHSLLITFGFALMALTIYQFVEELATVKEEKHCGF